MTKGMTTTIYVGAGDKGTVSEWVVQITDNNNRYVADVHVFANDHRKVRRMARNAAKSRGIVVGSTESMFML